MFRAWLEENTKLSDSSIGKYIRAIRSITKDMLSEGVIEKDIYNVTASIEFDSMMKDISVNKIFNMKDTKGNRMYSVAMKHYSDFLKSR